MSIRCFVAIEIENQRTLTEVLKVKHSLEDLDLDIKPVEDTDIHLTIRFLGHISTSTVEIMKNILQNIGQTMSKFEIEIQGLGAFPSISKPRVIWVGLGKGSEYLHDIRRIIDNEIRRRNLRDVFEDQHEFSPHITLARVRSLKNINLFYELYRQYNDYKFGLSTVTKIKLKQSILTPQGPIYKDLFITDLR
ncbi:MAG: RNA 2',3'-cyclic phosphodiesterase [Ignisphaera sp.]